jgi:hypothetical protein
LVNDQLIVNEKHCKFCANDFANKYSLKNHQKTCKIKAGGLPLLFQTITDLKAEIKQIKQNKQTPKPTVEPPPLNEIQQLKAELKQLKTAATIRKLKENISRLKRNAAADTADPLTSTSSAPSTLPGEFNETMACIVTTASIQNLNAL